MTEVEKYFSEIDTNSAEETKIHDQKNSQLCHSFAVISGLRYIVRNFLKSEEVNDDVLNMMKDNRESSFYKTLATFLGCVNPRSFDEVFQEQVSNNC